MRIQHGPSILAVLAAMAVALISFQALAFSADEKRQLELSVSNFLSAMKAGEHAGLLDYMPSRMTERLAEMNGVSEETLKAETARLMEELMSSVVVKFAKMDAVGATFDTTPDGSREYAIMPTEFVFAAVGLGHIRMEEHTLAFLENDEWRFVRTSEGQAFALLLETYPEFKSVPLPEPMMEKLD